MRTLNEIHGVICPLVTPFDEKGQIDYRSMRQLVDFLLTRGIHGVMIGGTTGEGPLLSMDERKALCEVVVEHVADRVPVIAHTGCIGTADTIELTVHAESAGVDAAAVIVPYFFTLDNASLSMHYRSVANAVPEFPLFVYVFPGNTKNDISPALLRQIRSDAPNIVGIKSSNPDLIRFQEYIDAGGEGFIPFNGVDGLMLPALTLGAVGQVSGNANVFPEVFCALYNAFVTGDIEQAQAQQRVIHRIRRVLKVGLHPGYFKAALALRGLPIGYVRPPMREPNEQEMGELKQSIRELGLMPGL